MLFKRNLLKNSSIRELILTNKNTIAASNNSYSQALFELASENNLTDQIEEQILDLLNMISKSTDFKFLIEDPTTKINDQLLVIKKISQKFSLNNLLEKFLCFIISKRRFFYVEKILKDFVSICSNARGEIEAELLAAKSLNQNEINNLKNELASNFGSNIKLNYKHDPSLIGGLIIKVGSIMVDTSIKNKLQQLEKKMIEA